MRSARLIVALALGAAGTAVAAQGPAASPARNNGCPESLLFIGNSYTYFNNVPEMVAALMAAGAGCHVQTRMIAPGGAQLRKQWADDHTRAALTERKWDYVILQEQSTLGRDYYVDGNPRVVGDELFAPAAALWSKAARDAGAQPVFYLTWSRKATPEDQAALNHAYFSAARQAGAPVAPAGIAWQLVRRERPDLELYWKDGSHPSPAGSYLAACAIYATLLHRDPSGLPSRITGTPISVEGKPVDPSTVKVEAGKSPTLVDLAAGDAAEIQGAAWRAWVQVSKEGADHYLAAGAEPAPVLPAGEPLLAEDLAGLWRGKLYFYPFLGTVDMTLRLEKTDHGWRGRLNLEYQDKDMKPESLDLADLNIGPRQLVFSDSSSAGIRNRLVKFVGVRHGAKLIGTATTISPREGEPPLTVLGHWILQDARQGPNTDAREGRQ
ncbi:MAG TPA: SGNH/GDSL hydrolase family protein [Thermoanaerobaculia bacterium]|nr:SGNH/GDSL hydrolase family protein [Thermoanaerobaculia bacterium]